MSKRSNGEGSVYERNDGRWVGSLVVDGRRKSFYGKTRAEAKAKLRAAQRRVEQGMPATDARTQLGTYIATWIETTLAASSRRVATQSQYASLLRSHVVPHLGTLSLGSVRPQHVERLLLELSKPRPGTTKPRLAASSRRSLYAALSAVFDSAQRDGLLARNPVRAVARPTAERTEARYLDDTELARLVEKVRDDRLRGLWLLLAVTGMRRGEALALRWDTVNLDKRTLRVTHTRNRVAGHGIVVGEPKSKQSRRTIKLSSALVAELRTHRTRQLEERLAAGSVWTETDHVFTTEIGTPLDPSNVSRYFKELAEAAGLPGATLHTLRHSAATALLSSGFDVATVAKLLGHGSPNVTLGVYAHVLPASEEQAAEHLGAIL